MKVNIMALFSWIALILIMATVVHSNDLEFKPGDDGVRFGQGPNGGWVATWGGIDAFSFETVEEWEPGINVETGNAIVIDDEGYLYVAGKHHSVTDLDPGPAENLTREPGGSLSKFDRAGNLVWAINWEANAYDLAIGPDGDLYVVGGMSQNIDLDPSPYISANSDHGRHGNVFGYVSRITSDGQYVWGRSWGAVATSLAVTEAGIVLVGGYFKEPTNFNPNSGVNVITPVGRSSAYLGSLTSDGEYIDTLVWKWIEPELEIEGEYTDEGDVYVCALDTAQDGSIYVAGYFSGPVDFDPGEGVEIRDGGRFSTNYLCKFNPEYDFAWVRAWGQLWVGHSMGCDVGPDGYVHVTGTFQWYDDFDPGPGEEYHEAVDDYDIYVTRFSSDGEHQWARTWGDRAREEAGDVTVDNDGNVYITGLYQLTTDLDPGPGQNIHEGAHAGGALIVKLTSAGDYIWGTSIRPYDEGAVGGRSIAVDESGFVYVTGFFSGLTDFDPGEGSELHHSIDGLRDAFLIMIMPDGSW